MLVRGEAGDDGVRGRGRGEHATHKRSTSERVVAQHATSAAGRVLNLEAAATITIIHLQRDGVRSEAEVLVAQHTYTAFQKKRNPLFTFFTGEVGELIIF